jgi:hypothetical protein
VPLPQAGVVGRGVVSWTRRSTSAQYEACSAFSRKKKKMKNGTGSGHGQASLRDVVWVQPTSKHTADGSTTRAVSGLSGAEGSVAVPYFAGLLPSYQCGKVVVWFHFHVLFCLGTSPCVARAQKALLSPRCLCLFTKS